MDVEDVKASYFDVMRMAGEIVISKPGTQIFKKKVDERAVPEICEDSWKQTKAKDYVWRQSVMDCYNISSVQEEQGWRLLNRKN